MDEARRHRAHPDQVPATPVARAVVDWVVLAVLVTLVMAVALAEVTGVMAGFVHDITFGH